MNLKGSRAIGLTMGAAVAAAAVAAGVGLAAPQSAHSASSRSVKVVLPHFSVFNKKMSHAAATDPEPAIIDQMTGAMAPPYMGASPNVTEATAADGRQIWLVGSSGGICIAVEKASGKGSAGTCDTRADADANGVSGMFLPDNGPQTWFGVVPDGNANVRLTTGSGTTMTVPVTGNVFSATSKTGFVGITFRNASGTMTSDSRHTSRRRAH